MRRYISSTLWATSIIIRLLQRIAQPSFMLPSIRPFSQDILNLPTRSTPGLLLVILLLKRLTPVIPLLHPYPSSDTNLSPSWRESKFVRPTFLGHHFERCRFSSRWHQRYPCAWPTSQMPLLRIKSRPRRKTCLSLRKNASFLKLLMLWVILPPVPSP